MPRPEGYRCWDAMNQRCYNPNNTNYKRYGARGIKVHPAWRHDFNKFIEDVGPRPSTNHSIERVDNSGDYIPGNVMWATASEQANNRSNNNLMELCGVTKTKTAWAREYGMSQEALNYRLRHMSLSDALTKPLRPNRLRKIN